MHRKKITIISIISLIVAIFIGITRKKEPYNFYYSGYINNVNRKKVANAAIKDIKEVAKIAKLNAHETEFLLDNVKKLY